LTCDTAFLLASGSSLPSVSPSFTFQVSFFDTLLQAARNFFSGTEAVSGTGKQSAANRNPSGNDAYLSAAIVVSAGNPI
jgi:hypothetical protein